MRDLTSAVLIRKDDNSGLYRECTSALLVSLFVKTCHSHVSLQARAFVAGGGGVEIVTSSISWCYCSSVELTLHGIKVVLTSSKQLNILTFLKQLEICKLSVSQVSG